MAKAQAEKDGIPIVVGVDGSLPSLRGAAWAGLAAQLWGQSLDLLVGAHHNGSGGQIVWSVRAMGGHVVSPFGSTGHSICRVEARFRSARLPFVMNPGAERR